ncbi:monovalent cation:proton antiporter-2 (CPA2) family protein [Parasphingorhabdus sp.]|uniref:monovalent cation:proton antiporter-2 (CPA2) family protein n=1 Tax=Parasphingorhabdus sp. TaxID=2709688 RepID=UPI003264B105
MADFLLLAFIFLVAGVIAVPIASRFGLGSVLGYLIAGILISPTLNFLGVDVVAVQHFAEFGVVMMLFLVGLELEPKLLWEMRGRLVGLGGGQVLGTAVIIMALALFLGQAWQVSVAIGLVLALSSTAIVLQSLNEKGLMKSDGGQASFSVLLFQDIAVIPMLALLPLLAVPELVGAAEAGHDSSLSLVADLNSWQTALVTLGAIAFVVFGGNYLTRPIFRFIAAARLRELFTAAALMMIIGIALLMTLVGLSPALGTFLAGVVLANSEYRHELESDIEPFKGLLLGLFFMTVGAGINFALLTENAGPIIGLTLGLIFVKILVLLVLGSLFNIPGAHRWLFALSLAQAGEFGFVLLAFTVANGILPDAIADKLLLVVALSMLLTPLLFILYDRVIAPLYNREQEREADHIPDASPIIIAGRGRVGGIVDRILESAGYKSTVIDFSSVQLGRLQKFGINAYFGDATRPDLLRSAGIAEAKMLIVAIDGKEQITKLVRHAVQTYPDLHVIARAVDRDHVYELWSVGCRDIIRESYDSSVRMGRSAFEAIGIPRETADRMVGIFQDADRRSMIEFADVYDIDIPFYENEALIAKARQLQDEWEPELREQIIAIMNGQGVPD